MSFASLEFALFLPIVFVLYRFVFSRTCELQNRFLLLAGYVFYGWWDWRFVGLLMLMTLLSYGCALPQTHRRAWAAVSVTGSLAILAFFKYFHFFGENLQRLFGVFGFALDWFTIEILLPLGISFYTFQAISYSIDVYRGRIEPERRLDVYALYIAFFPQLVAGPIERAERLLPQFRRLRTWNYPQAVEGLRLILWGLFKKLAMADGVAFFVDIAYQNHANNHSLVGMSWALMGVLAFSIQIYGDFSGYCDIAKGAAKLFGIELMDNFLYPFFSRNAIEFWRRWHRALNEWFVQYVYFPLGGSRRGNKYVNAMIVFLLSGLWHGADWTFVLWGAACGVWYLITVWCGCRRYSPVKDAPASRRDAVAIVTTFWLVSLVRILFRSSTLSEAVEMTHTVVPFMAASWVVVAALAWVIARSSVSISALVAVVIIVVAVAACVRPVEVIRVVVGGMGFVWAAVVMWAEWRSRTRSFALEVMPRSRALRAAIYVGLYIVILTCVDTDATGFIYFRF